MSGGYRELWYSELLTALGRTLPASSHRAHADLKRPVARVRVVAP
jgi:hypothetical protein